MHDACLITWLPRQPHPSSFLKLSLSLLDIPIILLPNDDSRERTFLVVYFIFDLLPSFKTIVKTKRVLLFNCKGNSSLNFERERRGCYFYLFFPFFLEQKVNKSTKGTLQCVFESSLSLSSSCPQRTIHLSSCPFPHPSTSPLLRCFPSNLQLSRDNNDSRNTPVRDGRPLPRQLHLQFHAFDHPRPSIHPRRKQYINSSLIFLHEHHNSYYTITHTRVQKTKFVWWLQSFCSPCQSFCTFHHTLITTLIATTSFFFPNKGLEAGTHLQRIQRLFFHHETHQLSFS